MPFRGRPKRIAPSGQGRYSGLNSQGVPSPKSSLSWLLWRFSRLLAAVTHRFPRPLKQGVINPSPSKPTVANRIAIAQSGGRKYLSDRPLADRVFWRLSRPRKVDAPTKRVDTHSPEMFFFPNRENSAFRPCDEESARFTFYRSDTFQYLAGNSAVCSWIRAGCISAHVYMPTCFDVLFCMDKGGTFQGE